MLRVIMAAAVTLLAIAFPVTASDDAPLQTQSCPNFVAIAPLSMAQVSPPVEFSWTSDPYATYYHIIVEKAHFSSWTKAYENLYIYSTSHTVDLAPGDYRWKVHAVDGSCQEVNIAAIQFTVQNAPPPVIENFDASPRRIRRGQSTTLLWSASEATGVTISDGVGSHPARGSITVSPQSPVTYTLTATGPGGKTSAQVTVDVRASADVVVSAPPQPMVQGTGAGGATTSYVLTNVGGDATTVTLTQQGDFFEQSPQSFTLQPGASQRISITGLQRDTGSFRGASVPAGPGVPSGASVPINLLAVPTPSGPTAAEPKIRRIDIAGPAGTNPAGTATFINTGAAPIQGSVVSTVPWLIPSGDLIEVDPGQEVAVPFSINRSRRPPDSELGSVEGGMSLVFRTGPSAKVGIEPHDGAAATTTLVTIVDTSSPPVTPGEIPPLAAGEVALFIPGTGHVEGGAGLFFSDIALVNLSGSSTLDDISMFYTPIGPDAQTMTTTVSGLAAGTPLPIADVVRTVFDAESTLGSLQIRTPDVDRLSVNANILLRTRDGEQQIVGNTIPALRSDRSVGAGESVFVTGLTRTDTSHTNLFIQETAGGDVIVDMEFFDESGQKLGERTGVTAGPFRLTGLFYNNADPIMPLGAVTAVITSRSESSGRFAAYATPVDRVSGDSWSLVDWNAQNAFSGTEDMVIPVAGALRGGGDLYFRTDVAVANRGDTTASGTLRYIRRPSESNTPIDRTITLGPGQSVVLQDVTSSLFEVDPSQFTLGFMKFLPQSGSMTLTSRNFATEGENPGTYGTGVATMPITSSIRLGEVRRIGAVKDSSLERITEKATGTFRSNFGIMETSGAAPVTVRVTVHFTYSTGATAVARGSGSREYTLAPHEFIQLARVSREILGESRDDFGDFDNLQVEFGVVDGDGAAAFFVSSVENDSGDSILRVE